MIVTHCDKRVRPKLSMTRRSYYAGAALVANALAPSHAVQLAALPLPPVVGIVYAHAIDTHK
jgi:hypothetical protein